MDSVILNGFSFEILANYGNGIWDPLEKIIYKNAYYYSLPDKSEYKLRIGNDHGVIVDAHVSIDNNKIGIWRVNPYSKITINKIFILDNRITGLFFVEFRPEKISTYTPKVTIQQPDPTESYYLCQDYTDTVTPYDKRHRDCAMDDESYNRYIYSKLSPTIYKQQKPTKVASIDNVDMANITKIYARLVIDNDKSIARRKYMPIHDIKTEQTKTTIPPQITMRHPSRPSPQYDKTLPLSRTYYFDRF